MNMNFEESLEILPYGTPYTFCWGDFRFRVVKLNLNLYKVSLDNFDILLSKAKCLWTSQNGNKRYHSYKPLLCVAVFLNKTII